MVLEFLHGNPGVLAGLALGSMAGALLLGPVAWRIAGEFHGSFRRLWVCWGLLAFSVCFGATFILATVMLLSSLRGGG